MNPWCEQVERAADMLAAFECNLLSIEIECPHAALCAVERIARSSSAQSSSEPAVEPIEDAEHHSDVQLDNVERSAEGFAVEGLPKHADSTAILARGAQVIRRHAMSMGGNVQSAGWPRVEGAGLFELIATINHSCRPNCRGAAPLRHTNSHRLVACRQVISTTYVWH
eukprot:SAG11_NODE_5178_length_1639_cov_0.934416_2_plen_168_part_00